MNVCVYITNTDTDTAKYMKQVEKKCITVIELEY